MLLPFPYFNNYSIRNPYTFDRHALRLLVHSLTFILNTRDPIPYLRYTYDHHALYF